MLLDPVVFPVFIAIVAIMAIILVVVFLFFIERDILRSNHYRQELEKSKRRAEGLLMAREKLMLTITHDIKLPSALSWAISTC